MDEIRRLEREIKELQEQLRRQNAEAARARQNLIDENKRSLQSYQNDMRRAIRDHDQDTQKEFERLLREYQRNIDRDVEVEMAKMGADYEHLLNDVKRNEAILLQKNQELEQAIAAIRSDVTKRNEGSSQEAKEYLQNAVGMFQEVASKPHEKFMPKRMMIFYNSIKDGQQLFKAGLFEAATAVAIAAKAGLERLGYAIDDKAVEWEHQYELFSMKLGYLQAKIQQELTDWEAFIGETNDGDSQKKKKHLIQINYWTRGVFAIVFQRAKKYQQIVARVNETGKDAYLKLPDSASTDDLKEYISDIESFDRQLADVVHLYKQRYSASCERADWGEAIIDFLTDEINLIWHDELTGFREVSAEERGKKEFIEYIQTHFDDLSICEDTREWLKLVFENTSENRIYIYILPLESKCSVINHVVIHIDYNGPEQELYSRDLYQHVCEAIQHDEESENVVNYEHDVNALKLSENRVYSETGKDLDQMKRKR